MWNWQQALGHVKLISDELEHGNCCNMTPETGVRLCVEMQPVPCLLRGQERLTCKDRSQEKTQGENRKYRVSSRESEWTEKSGEM